MQKKSANSRFDSYKISNKVEDATKNKPLPTIVEDSESNHKLPKEEEFSSLSPLPVKYTGGVRQGIFLPFIFADRDLSGRQSLNWVLPHRQSESNLPGEQNKVPIIPYLGETIGTVPSWYRASLSGNESESRGAQYSIISPRNADVFKAASTMSTGQSLDRFSMLASTNPSPFREAPFFARPSTSISHTPHPTLEFRTDLPYRKSHTTPESTPRTPTLAQATHDLEAFLAHFTSGFYRRTHNMHNEDTNMATAERSIPRQVFETKEDVCGETYLLPLKEPGSSQSENEGSMDKAKDTRKSRQRPKVRFELPFPAKGRKEPKHFTIRRALEDKLRPHQIKERLKDTKGIQGDNGSWVSLNQEYLPDQSSYSDGTSQLSQHKESPHELPSKYPCPEEDHFDQGQCVKAESEQTGGPPQSQPVLVIDTVGMSKCNSGMTMNMTKNLPRNEHSQAPELIYEVKGGCINLYKHVCDFPANTPDIAILSVLRHVESLNDLFNMAVVNKHFYRIFKQHELPLIKEALRKMSPPAWEFREMSPPWDTEWQVLLDPEAQVPEYTPQSYLRHYAQDIYTLVQLKSFILGRCAPFLRRDTLLGLAGVDCDHAVEVDDAFWRIWTFCRIFGCAKNRENDIAGQLDWLNGGSVANSHRETDLNISSNCAVSSPFNINNVLLEPPPEFGRGNLDGLSPKQLYDMTEIWTCLGVLLQQLHGECVVARQVGIYDHHNVPIGDIVKEENVLSMLISLSFSKFKIN